MAADNLASYGSLARFKDVQRLHQVGTHTVIGASGDMSDFQYVQALLDDLIVEEFTEQDGHQLGPEEIHEYLSQIMYARRSKMNPLWNSLLVGGFKDGKGYVSPACINNVTQAIPDSCLMSTSWGQLTLHLRLPPVMARISLNLSFEEPLKGRRTL